MIRKKYQICNCCVTDTSDEDVTFDENGVCMRCNEYKERILPGWNYGKGHEKELEELIKDIKRKGTYMKRRIYRVECWEISGCREERI